MSLRDLLKKTVTGGEWFVAYRSVDDKSYKLVKAPENQWCADPFVFEADGEHYIFVEQYIKEKGCIGYFQFKDGEPHYKGKLIENSYHMSYPDVFSYDDRIYMIPESSANNTVDLYVADAFPQKWRKVKTLISEQKYVDSTVYQDEKDLYLISYSMIGGYEIHVFLLDMKNLNVKLISKKRYKRNVARPGGRLFFEDGKLMRPAQDCSRKYGEALIVYQVDDLNRNGEFVEHEVRQIKTDGLHIKKKPERIHHMTNDGTYEVIDVYKERIDLLHIPRIFWRARRK